MDTPSAPRVGRPRSEQARDAVLHAVDDLLTEVGYAAMTMKGIAERAGVGRQTVYRWWATKAEILLEASVEDAREELAVPDTGDAHVDLTAYVAAVVRFLSASPAGAAYRALLGEAQHDAQVAELLAGQDVLLETARAVLVRAADPDPPSSRSGSARRKSASAVRREQQTLDGAAAMLVGPVLFWVIGGHDPATLSTDVVVGAAVSALSAPPTGR